ncbi:hypothetical protein N9Y42_08925 [Mariniblastus sp.]|nr:hypothetical protein [Mariniblastus sp.]
MYLLAWELDRRLTIESVALYEGEILEMAPFFAHGKRTLQDVDPRYPPKKSRGVEVKIQYVDEDGKSKQYLREYPLPFWDYHKPGDQIVLAGFLGMCPEPIWSDHPKVCSVISRYASPKDELSTEEFETLACLKQELAANKEMILDMRQSQYSPKRFEALKAQWDLTH